MNDSQIIHTDRITYTYKITANACNSCTILISCFEPRLLDRQGWQFFRATEFYVCENIP